MLTPSTEVAEITLLPITVQTPSRHFFQLGGCPFLKIDFKLLFSKHPLVFLLPIASKFNASLRMLPLLLFAKHIHTISQLPLLPFFQKRYGNTLYFDKFICVLFIDQSTSHIAIIIVHSVLIPPLHFLLRDTMFHFHIVLLIFSELIHSLK